MKEAKKVRITEQVCKQAQLMRKGGANQTEIGKLLGVNPCTISRIEAAGFDFDTYTKNLAARRAREKQEEKKPEEEPITGQMKMDLTQEEKPEMSEPVKLMRFQAGMTGKITKKIEDQALMIIMKLDQLNDTLHMILRAVWKE